MIKHQHQPLKHYQFFLHSIWKLYVRRGSKWLLDVVFQKKHFREENTLQLPMSSHYGFVISWPGIKSQMVDKYEGDTFIYIDGSKIKVGTGSAFCAFESTVIHTWKTRISGESSVFQANKNSIQPASNSYFSSFTISSDGLSRLLAMQNTDTRDHQFGKILQLKTPHKSFL